MRSRVKMPSVQKSPLLAAMILSACGTTVTPSSPTDASTDSAVDASGVCVPDRATWDSSIRAKVVAHCGTCHGETPTYGAPYSLMNYDALLAGAVGHRHVDAIAEQLATGAMPPPGAPAPLSESADAVTRWASCGARTAMNATRLQSSRSWVRAPERAPEGLSTWDLRADHYAVGLNVTDRYQCFTFTVPGDGPRFIRRFEMLLDRREVLHHVVLLRDPDRTAPERPFECTAMNEGSQYLMAWAPGQDAFAFPDGGLRMTPGERYVLQLHYNNSRRLAAVVATSGVRLFHGPPTGTEYGMLAIGPVGFSIPARSTASASSGCTFREPTRLFAGGPHMHVIGTAFSQQVMRMNGNIDPLISVDHWDFNYQFIYDLGPTLIAPGDRIETRCTWNNTSARTVYSGTGTADEMCFDFAYVTPPSPDRYCDQPLRMPGELTYTPGRCAPPAAGTSLPMVTGRMVVDPAPAPTGGTIPDGRWNLTGMTWHVDTASTAIGTIDVNASVIVGRGQIWTEPGRIIADLSNRVELAFTGGVRFDRDIPVSVSGTYTGDTPTRTFRQTCPNTGSTHIAVSVEGDRMVLGFDPTNFGGVMITPRYTFQRAM